MTAALFLWAGALAQDLAGAPAEAQASLGLLGAGVLALLGWGLVLEARERAARRRWQAAERLSRCLFAAAGVRRRYRLP